MSKVVNTAGNVTKEKGVRAKEEFIYCAQFNRGTCVEAGTHKGRFAGREGVTLNHACKKCLQERGLRVGHAEVDDRCPFKIKDPLI